MLGPTLCPSSSFILSPFTPDLGPALEVRCISQRAKKQENDWNHQVRAPYPSRTRAHTVHFVPQKFYNRGSPAQPRHQHFRYNINFWKLHQHTPDWIELQPRRSCSRCGLHGRVAVVVGAGKRAQCLGCECVAIASVRCHIRWSHT